MAVDSSVDLFASYAQLWSTTTFVDLLMQPYLIPSAIWSYVLSLLLGLTLLLPMKITFGAAVVTRLAMTLVRMPYVFDSCLWTAQTDFVLLLAMLLVPRRSVSPCTTWVIRCQLGLFYLAAGFWKLTHAFLSTATSCAPIFSLSLASYLPEVLRPPWLMRQLAAVSPSVTIATEMSIGLLLLSPSRTARRLGVLMCALLHLGICLTPYPNQIATFSILCLSRMANVIQPSWAAAQAEAISATPTTVQGVVYRAIAVACVSASAGLSSNPAVKVDWAVVYYVFLCFLVGRALHIDRSSSVYLGHLQFHADLDAYTMGVPVPGLRIWTHAAATAAGWLCVLAAFVYAFCLQPLGTLDSPDPDPRPSRDALVCSWFSPQLLGTLEIGATSPLTSPLPRHARHRRGEPLLEHRCGTPYHHHHHHPALSSGSTAITHRLTLVLTTSTRTRSAAQTTRWGCPRACSRRTQLLSARGLGQRPQAGAAVVARSCNGWAPRRNVCLARQASTSASAAALCESSTARASISTPSTRRRSQVETSPSSGSLTVPRSCPPRPLTLTRPRRPRSQTCSHRGCARCLRRLGISADNSTQQCDASSGRSSGRRCPDGAPTAASRSFATHCRRSSCAASSRRCVRQGRASRSRTSSCPAARRTAARGGGMRPGRVSHSLRTAEEGAAVRRRPLAPLPPSYRAWRAAATRSRCSHHQRRAC